MTDKKKKKYSPLKNLKQCHHNIEIWAAKFLSQNYVYAAKGEQTGLERN